MLKSLDVLIGLAVVMLVLSMAVTLITQFITASLLNLRGVVLKGALARLLALMDNGLHPKEARAVTDYVLRNYLISRNGKLAGTVHREEFTKLVMSFAASGPSAKVDKIMKSEGIFETAWRYVRRKLVLIHLTLLRTLRGDAAAKADDAAVTGAADFANAVAAQASAAAAIANAADPVKAAADLVATAATTTVAEIASIAADANAPGWRTRVRLKDLSEALKTADGERKIFQNLMKDSLSKNGVTNPEELLAKVRNAVLALELAKPELANDVRQTKALIETLPSDYLAKMNAWFDQTVDRASDIFTAHSRAVAVLIALLLPFTLEINVIEIVNRLSADPTIREQIVKAALDHPERFKSVATDGTATSAVQSGHEKTEDVPQHGKDKKEAPADDKGQFEASDSAPKTAAGVLKAISENKDFRLLTTTDVLVLPDGFDAWVRYWSINPCKSPGGVFEALRRYKLMAECKPSPKTEAAAAPKLEQGGKTDTKSHTPEWLGRLMGVLLSVVLLSFGAPIWYELLANLISLRSLVARRDDQQRDVRQTTQTATTTVSGQSLRNGP